MTTATDVLARGRAAAEELMIDACTIKHAIAGRTFDQVLGRYTGSVGPEVYDGPCQVQIASLGDAMSPTVEGGGPVVQQLVLKLPVATSGTVAVNDLAVITACVADPSLVDARFRITAIHHKSYATARRLQCEEITDG